MFQATGLTLTKLPIILSYDNDLRSIIDICFYDNSLLQSQIKCLCFLSLLILFAFLTKQVTLIRRLTVLRLPLVSIPWLPNTLVKRVKEERVKKYEKTFWRQDIQQNVIQLNDAG